MNTYYDLCRTIIIKYPIKTCYDFVDARILIIIIIILAFIKCCRAWCVTCDSSLDSNMCFNYLQSRTRVIGTMKDNKGSPQMSGEEGAECVRNVSVSDPVDPLIQQTFPVLSAPKLLTP